MGELFALKLLFWGQNVQKIHEYSMENFSLKNLTENNQNHK